MVCFYAEFQLMQWLVLWVYLKSISGYHQVWVFHFCELITLYLITVFLAEDNEGVWETIFSSYLKLTVFVINVVLALVFKSWRYGVWYAKIGELGNLGWKEKETVSILALPLCNFVTEYCFVIRNTFGFCPQFLAQSYSDPRNFLSDQSGVSFHEATWSGDPRWPQYWEG